MVSTTVGAEGLGVTAGEELLIADDDLGLATACLRLLGDEPLRRALTDRAEALYERSVPVERNPRTGRSPRL